MDVHLVMMEGPEWAEIVEGHTDRSVAEARKDYFVENPRLVPLEKYSQYVVKSVQVSGETNPDLVLRPSVQTFAQAMEAKLRTRDEAYGTEGWKAMSVEHLFDRLCNEQHELFEAVYDSDENVPNMQGEAVDIANFAMMIFDVLGDCRD